MEGAQEFQQEQWRSVGFLMEAGGKQRGRLWQTESTLNKGDRFLSGQWLEGEFGRYP